MDVFCPFCWGVFGRSISCDLKWLKSCMLCYLFDLDTISLIFSTEGLSHIPDCGLGSLIQSLEAHVLSIWFIHWQKPLRWGFQTSDHSEKSSLQCNTHTSLHTNKNLRKQYLLLLCVTLAAIFCPVLFWVFFFVYIYFFN